MRDSYLDCRETCSDYNRSQRLVSDLSALPIDHSSKPARATELKISQKPTIIHDLLRSAISREDPHEGVLIM